MTPERAGKYAKAVLVPLLTAGVVAWNEHRSAQNRERQDATYASTAPVLVLIQAQQKDMAERLNDLTKLVTAHIIQHPGQRAEVVPAAAPRFGAGSGSGGQSAAVVRRRAQAVAIAFGQEQVDIAKKLKEEPAITTIQRSIPASPDEALQQVKR